MTDGLLEPKQTTIILKYPMSEATSPQRLAKEGKSAYKRGDYLAAAQTYQAATQGYRSAGETQKAAEMANNCSVAYLQAGMPQAALEAVEGTAQVFAQAADLSRQGMALGNQATALEELERLEEAAEVYRQAADLLQEAGEDQKRAEVMKSLSMLQFRSGRQLQALATMQDGLEKVERPTPKQKLLKKLLRIPFEMMNKNKA